MKKKMSINSNPFAFLLLKSTYFKSKVVKNKKKYNRKRDKKVKLDIE